MVLLQISEMDPLGTAFVVVIGIVFVWVGRYGWIQAHSDHWRAPWLWYLVVLMSAVMLLLIAAAFIVAIFGLDG